MNLFEKLKRRIDWFFLDKKYKKLFKKLGLAPDQLEVK